MTTKKELEKRINDLEKEIDQIRNDLNQISNIVLYPKGEKLK